MLGENGDYLSINKDFSNKLNFTVQEFTEVKSFLSHPKIYVRLESSKPITEFYYREKSSTGIIHLHFFEFNFKAAFKFSNNTLNMKYLRKSFKYLFTIDEKEVDSYNLKNHKITFKVQNNDKLVNSQLNKEIQKHIPSSKFTFGF